MIVTRNAVEAATMRKILDDIIDTMDINYDSLEDTFFPQTPTDSCNQKVIYLMLRAAEVLDADTQRIINYLKDLDWPVVCATRFFK